MPFQFSPDCQRQIFLSADPEQMSDQHPWHILSRRFANTLKTHSIVYSDGEVEAYCQVKSTKFEAYWGDNEARDSSNDIRLVISLRAKLAIFAIHISDEFI